MDSYLTLARTSESLFKDKGSKHFGYAFPVSTEDDIIKHISDLRKQHHTARHVCYAWTIGIENPKERWNDDGEPHNSAGPPILRQIHAHNLRNVLICVVRYFGGTKLGIPGLINAYKTAAAMAIENNEIIERTLKWPVEVLFGYEDMNPIQQIARSKGVEVVSTDFAETCRMTLLIPKTKYATIYEKLCSLHRIQVKKL